GPAGHEMLPELLFILDTTPDIQSRVIKCVTAMGPAVFKSDAKVTALLLEKIESLARGGDKEAILALTKFGPQAATYVVRLTRLLKDRDKLTRSWAETMFLATIPDGGKHIERFDGLSNDNKRGLYAPLFSFAALPHTPFSYPDEKVLERI